MSGEISQGKVAEPVSAYRLGRFDRLSFRTRQAIAAAGLAGVITASVFASHASAEELTPQDEEVIAETDASTTTLATEVSTTVENSTTSTFEDDSVEEEDAEEEVTTTTEAFDPLGRLDWDGKSCTAVIRGSGAPTKYNVNQPGGTIENGVVHLEDGPKSVVLLDGLPTTITITVEKKNGTEHNHSMEGTPECGDSTTTTIVETTTTQPDGTTTTVVETTTTSPDNTTTTVVETTTTNPDTTTTTVIETTTTSPDNTTTTILETTTTNPDGTTTTIVETTTTAADGTTTTSIVEVINPPKEDDDDAETLPFTGGGHLGYFALMGVAATTLGGAVAWGVRRKHVDPSFQEPTEIAA